MGSPALLCRRGCGASVAHWIAVDSRESGERGAFDSSESRMAYEGYRPSAAKLVPTVAMDGMDDRCSRAPGQSFVISIYEMLRSVGKIRHFY